MSGKVSLTFSFNFSKELFSKNWCDYKIGSKQHVL